VGLLPLLIITMPNKQKRTWQPREMLMVQEWLVRTHPEDMKWTRVRVGQLAPEMLTPVGSEEEERAATGWRRWVDAIVITKEKVIMIEAAIRPNPGKISQLELYDELFEMTPEFKKYWGWKRELMILYAIEDPATVYLARKKGILCVRYVPDWLEAYLPLLFRREQRGSVHALPKS